MARTSIRNLSATTLLAAAREAIRESREREAKAAALRESTAAHEQASYESHQHSDTDGFLSQWAHGVCAREDRLAAEIAEAGGTAEFPALFDLDGSLIPARRTRGQYGWRWELLNQRGRRIGWFNESRAKSVEGRRQAHAAKGFYVGVVRAPAEATTQEGEVRGVAVVAERTDGGWSHDVEIVDNGH